MQLSGIIRPYNEAPAGRFAFWVGLSVAMVSASVNIRSISNDNIPNVLIPVSVLREGNLELGEFQNLIAGYKDKVCYWAVKTDRGTFSRYPIWAGVAATPFFISHAFNRTQSLEESSLLRTGRFAAVFACGLFAGLFAATLRRFTTGIWAAVLTAFTVLGTTLQHQLGANLSNQTLPLVCIAATLFLVARPRLSRAQTLCAGLLAGLAVASRLPALFIALAPLGVFITQREWRRQIPLVALGLAVFPAITLFYQHTAFGSAFATGYGDESSTGFSAPMLQGFAGLLFSPTCGLLIYSPWLILALPATWRLIRLNAGSPAWGQAANHDASIAIENENANRPTHAQTIALGRWLLLGIVGQWLLFSKWWAWNGALAFGGPRMLAEAIPALSLLIAMIGPISTAHSNHHSRAAKWLLALGIFAVLHFAIGSACYDAIAPDNPIKSDWDIRADFISLMIEKHGATELARLSMGRVALLTVAAAVAGYMTSRLLKTNAD